jgi:hypothetical protein
MTINPRSEFAGSISTNHLLPATHVQAESCLEHDNRPRTSECLEGNFGITKTQPAHWAVLSNSRTDRKLPPLHS